MVNDITERANHHSKKVGQTNTQTKEAVYRVATATKKNRYRCDFVVYIFLYGCFMKSVLLGSKSFSSIMFLFFTEYQVVREFSFQHSG